MRETEQERHRRWQQAILDNSEGWEEAIEANTWPNIEPDWDMGELTWPNIEPDWDIGELAVPDTEAQQEGQ